MIAQASRSQGPSVAPTRAARPIRVLYYIAYPQRLAGANRSLYELVTGLPSTVTPLVVTAGDGAAAQAFRQAGVETMVALPGGALASYGHAGHLLGLGPLGALRTVFTGYAPYLLSLARLIREHEIDLVHANDVRGTLMAGVAARLAGRPVISHIRGEETQYHPALWALYEQIPTRFITVADALGAGLSPPARRRSVTVYNGIQERAVAGGEPPLWLAELRAQGRVLVGCFASVVPFKGYHHLIEAVAALNRAGLSRRFSLVCVGDFVRGYEGYQSWLRRRLAEPGLENVIFTGWQPDPFAIYHGLDLTVLPSVSHERLLIDGAILEIHGGEGFPRTHLEAMWLGLPIVGTAIAGVGELVLDGVTGYVVPPGNPGALATALSRLIIDPALRATMGAAGRRRVAERFSTDRCVNSTLAVYRAALPAAPGGDQ